jgi:catechol 2,3-dioxygenase-like lactoylglutathione lyase family enzyme
MAAIVPTRGLIHTREANREKGKAMPIFGRAVLAALLAASAVNAQPQRDTASAGKVLWQPSMNVFRRHDVPAERMFEFYGGVLGFEQLATLGVGNGGGVARFKIGAQELKLTRRVPNRRYEPGGVQAATGLRSLTFFFDDERSLVARFTAHGLVAPKFVDEPDGRRTALVEDPDGQAVELVVLRSPVPDALEAIEVGLTVADPARSREFYRGFVGLEELPPSHDPRFGTVRYRFRHGATTIVLRSFGAELPADTGSGGIQYVVTDVALVDRAARARGIRIDQPLSVTPGFDLRTLWLDDPDGVTNYFAETGASRKGRL